METLQSGATFGPYVVEGLIAGGGMGQVYAARHEVYSSVCALKVLHEKLHEDAGWRARFNAEGLVGTQLKHPHVLSAREMVEHEGRVAIVMDLVKGGQTLEKVVSREFPKGLPISNALTVFLEIVQGIDYLHGKEIVHGDLKPENVMVEGEYRKPGSWTPKLTDFGTVGLIAHPVIIDGRTAVVATPRYASPEHLRGSDNLEVRSDVYCLGLILHFLLTGQHCSDARTVREAALFVMEEVPVVKLVDQPDSVLEIFRKAVQTKPGNRFEDCRELALAVRSALDELGVKLDLDDVKADLATEVDEERAAAQQENLSRAAEQADLDDLGETEAPTEVPPEPEPEEEEPEKSEAIPPGGFGKGTDSEVTLEPTGEPGLAEEDADTGDSVVDDGPPEGLSGQTTVARPAPEAPRRTEPISAPPPQGPGMAVLVPVAVAGSVVILLGGFFVLFFLI